MSILQYATFNIYRARCYHKRPRKHILHCAMYKTGMNLNISVVSYIISMILQFLFNLIPHVCGKADVHNFDSCRFCWNSSCTVCESCNQFPEIFNDTVAYTLIVNSRKIFYKIIVYKKKVKRAKLKVHFPQTKTS